MKLPTCMFIPACMFILLEKNSHLYVYSHLYYYSALKSNIEMSILKQDWEIRLSNINDYNLATCGLKHAYLIKFNTKLLA